MSKINIGVWTFRIGTTVLPLLQELAHELQNRSLDVWSLGYGAVACAIVALLHASRVGADAPAATTVASPPAPATGG